ncbi:methyltransferase domain-containing protein [soil metagenome]
MTSWSPETYLAYADERSRPFVDLVARIPIDATSIIDLGCGPGHLMPILRSRWSTASIVGVDSSPEMIARASSETDDPAITFVRADIATWRAEPVDLVISNAALQWVPGHLALISHLAEMVKPGGAFAFQVPHNYAMASHVTIRNVATREPYARYVAAVASDRDRSIDAATYLQAFDPQQWRVDAWETTYLHVLQGEDPVFDWVAGSRARPVIQALPEELRNAFEDDLKAALREAYPAGPHGTIFPFRRVFVVAVRMAR